MAEICGLYIQRSDETLSNEQGVCDQKYEVDKLKADLGGCCNSPT